MQPVAMAFRAILFHKQPTSARLRFMRLAHGGVCAPGPIPDLGRSRIGRPRGPAIHPAQVLRWLERELGFDVGSLRAEEGYRCAVDGPDGQIPVLLVGIDSVDPPFELAERIGAGFIDLTQARGLPALELELLRGAYEVVLGG